MGVSVGEEVVGDLVGREVVGALVFRFFLPPPAPEVSIAGDAVPLAGVGASDTKAVGDSVQV